MPSLALEYLLEAEQARSGASAMSVGTMDGLPIVGIGDVDPNELSAAGALKVAGLGEHAVLGALLDRVFRMSVVALPEGQNVLVTALGGDGLSPEVESGVVRILS